MFNNKPIKIGILEASPQTKAILEFFFDSSGKTIFKESSIEEASAYIIDYDFPGSKELWKEQFNKTQKPGIILSIKKTEIESTFWVSKPLTSKDLIEAGEKVNTFLENNTIKPLANEPAIATNAEQDNKQEISSVEINDVEQPKKNLSLNEKSYIKTPAKEKPKAELAFAGHENEQATIVDLTDDIENFSPNLDTATSNSTSNKDLSTTHFVENSDSNLHKDVELFKAIPNTTDFAISPNLIDVSMPKEDISTQAKELKHIKDTDENTKNEGDEIDSLLETLISEEEIKEQDLVDVIEQSSVQQDIEENEFKIVLSTIEDDDTLISANESLNLSEVDIDANTLQKTDESTSNSLYSNTTKPITSLDDDDLIDLVNQQVLRQENISDFDDIEKNLSPTLKLPLEEKESQSKPVSPEEDLKNLLEEIRLEAESATSTITPSHPVKSVRNAKSISHSRNKPTTSAEERWILTCGNYIRISKNSEMKKMAFNPKNYMLLAFKDVCEQSKNNDKVMRLKLKGQLFIVDYNRDSVYHDNPIFTDEYAEACEQEVDPKTIMIHDLDKAEERLYQKKMLDEPEYSHTIDSFIWTTSLLISRGRLPKNTDIHKKIGLKAWPNLTRLEQIPNAIQLAAIFSKTPGSLLEISNWVKFDQRFVFAFYNAALALDLIEFDSKKIRTISINPTKSSKVTTENRGFFSRLLKRIKS